MSDEFTTRTAPDGWVTVLKGGTPVALLVPNGNGRVTVHGYTVARTRGKGSRVTVAAHLGAAMAVVRGIFG